MLSPCELLLRDQQTHQYLGTPSFYSPYPHINLTLFDEKKLPPIEGFDQKRLPQQAFEKMHTSFFCDWIHVYITQKGYIFDLTMLIKQKCASILRYNMYCVLHLALITCYMSIYGQSFMSSGRALVQFGSIADESTLVFITMVLVNGNRINRAT